MKFILRIFFLAFGIYWRTDIATPVMTETYSNQATLWQNGHPELITYVRAQVLTAMKNHLPNRRPTIAIYRALSYVATKIVVAGACTPL